MSIKHPALTVQSLLALLLAGGAGLSVAQTDELDRVETRGRAVAAAPRLDVKASCPTIEAQLNDTLALPVYLYNETGTVNVQLAVDQGGVSSVQLTGGPRIYRRDVRRALQRLDCFQAQAGSSFMFQIAFVSAEAAERGETMAVRVGPQVLASK